MSTISIVLVDDHQVVTHSLRAYLESFPGLKVVGIAATAEELLAVLQDLVMPGVSMASKQRAESFSVARTFESSR